MSQLKEAKEKYDRIEIPEELSQRVQDAINRSAASREQEKKQAEKSGKKGENMGKITKIEGRHNMIKRSIQSAAAVVAAFTLLLNTSTVFAEEMSKVPVIGAVARVLTFRSYEKDEGDLKVSVEIPSVEMISQDTNGLADSINKEIHALCEQYANEAIQRAEEYKKAFMETGGTEEEWEEHNIEIKVWYEIKSQTEDYLSFAVMGTENWTTAYSETRYYNIDLKKEKVVFLEDLLGEDYIRIANESILSQIPQKEAETGMTFWTAEEDGFTTITENQRFYVNESGNPVVVFEKYEIAPGAAGEVEFEIVK